MTDRAATTMTPPIPTIVRRLNPLVRRLLRFGVPMGPNVLLTVRGRRSGLERTFPVAILEVGEGTYVFSPFGEVDWVLNSASGRRGRDPSVPPHDRHDRPGAHAGDRRPAARGRPA